MTAATNNTSVVVTTPRRSHGALLTDNNHKPMNAMYNVSETSRGITFELKGTTSEYPGTVLVIIFKLAPAGGGAGRSPVPPSTPSTSGSHTLSLSGPTANTLGSKFSYKVSIDASAPSLFLAFNPSGSSCAASASGYPRSSAHVHQTVPAGPVDVTFNFVAEPSGTFALCVYLASPATGATEARAAAYWTNS